MKSAAPLFIIFVGLVLSFTSLPAEATGVYVKLLPAKLICLGHYVFRDPEGDPVKVSFTHRALTPRLTSIRFDVFAPSNDPETHGKRLELEIGETIDTFGEPTPLYFDAEETGIYTVCMLSRRRHPIINLEVYFATTTEELEPVMTDDEAMAVDKPVELKDYDDRLRMLRVSVQTTRDEIRTAQTRRYMFDHTSKSIVNVVVGFAFFNMALAAALSYWSEKYMERFFVKEKTA